MSFLNLLYRANSYRARSLASQGRPLDPYTVEVIAQAIEDSAPPCTGPVHVPACQECTDARYAARFALTARLRGGMRAMKAPKGAQW